MKISISSPVATDVPRTPVAVKERPQTKIVSAASKRKSRKISARSEKSTSRDRKADNKSKVTKQESPLNHFESRRTYRDFTRYDRRKSHSRSSTKIKPFFSKKRKEQEKVRQIIKDFFLSLFNKPKTERPVIKKDRPHPRRLNGSGNSHIGFKNSSFPQDLARARVAA